MRSSGVGVFIMPTWWEYVQAGWDFSWTAFNSGKDQLLGVTGIGDALNLFLDPLGNLLVQLLALLFYPVYWGFQLLFNVINAILTPLITLFNALYASGNALFTIINVFEGVFPAPWMAGLTMILTLVIGLRIYSMIPGLGKK